MALTKIRLGDYIERSTSNNKDLKYGTDLITGVTNEGIFTSPKGNPEGVDLRPYKIVNNGAFVYNPTRLNLGSIAYRTEGLCIVSHLYIVFYLNDNGKKIIDPQYLFIYFRRKEFCREVTFRNFGSQRPEFSFNDMSDIEIPLPPYPVQQKYVDIYNAMLANQQSYEHGLDDLKLTCDAYIEKCKTSSDYFSLSELIEEFDERNTNLICNAAFGVNKEKQFMPTVASGDDLSKYKVVRKGQFACNLMHVGRDITIPVAFNNSTDFLVVSPAYLTFQTKSNLILPEYLLMWLSRDEIGRYAWYLCDASIRGSMEKKRFFEIAIPVPPIKEQQALVELFSALSIRKELLNKLRMQVKSLCPILIKGSIEEGMRTNEA